MAIALRLFLFAVIFYAHAPHIGVGLGRALPPETYPDYSRRSGCKTA